MLPLLFTITAADLDALAVLLKALRDALRHSDISQEKVSLSIRMNKGSVSRHLRHEGGLTLRRLSKLPDATLQWFAVGLLDQLGMPRELQRAVRLRLGLLGRKKMARMDAAKVPQRRSA